MTEAADLWEFFKPGGTNDQAVVAQCGYHGEDGLAHPCSESCNVLGCWYERRIGKAEKKSYEQAAGMRRRKQMGELKRVLAATAGVAAIVLGLLALINHQDPDVVYWLAGGVIAAGSGLVIGFI